MGSDQAVWCEGKPTPCLRYAVGDDITVRSIGFHDAKKHRYLPITAKNMTKVW